MKKLSYKYYNKRNTTRDTGNAQSHDQKESKLGKIKYRFDKLCNGKLHFLCSESAKSLFKWFLDNQMNRNTDKFHLIIINWWTATNSKWRFFSQKKYVCEKLLRAKIDSKLNFDDHIRTIYSGTSNKLRVLARAIPYRSIEKRRLLVNSFFNAKFS